MLYPPDTSTKEVNELHLLYFRALERCGHDVEIIGRITEKQFRETVPTSLPYRNFFECGDFEKDVNIEEAEEFISIPFKHVFNSNFKRWGWYCGDAQKAARYVPVWKEILKGTDILIPTLDNLFFIYSAIGVAERMNIRIFKFIKGRLIDDSVIFWNKHNQPIYYRQDGTETYGKFMERNEKKKIVRPGKKIDLIKGILSIPRKIYELENEFDVDIPSVDSKYSVLFERNIRTRFWPKLHSIRFEKPREEKYFLYPLHFEWEAQLAYREPFISQLEMARILCECLPANTYLYVKAHPHWKNCDQSFEFIDQLKRWNNNIRIIRPEENTTDLIKNSLGVIVINGTIGYEAIAQKKPLIVLGHEAYKSVAIDMKDLTLLPRILLKIKAGEYKIDEIAYERFLKRYSSIVVPTDDFEKFATEVKLALEVK